METIKLIVAYSDESGNPKGIMTEDGYNRIMDKSWIRHRVEIIVPKKDWDEEKIHIGNVKAIVSKQIGDIF
jgi:hypothetical protein